jgi:hypothetical protein
MPDSQSVSVSLSLQQGIQAARVGDKPEAILCLAAVLKQEPRNISAWLWLSAVMDDPVRKKDCLEKVLRIDPANPSALRGLEQLEGSKPAIASPAPLEIPANSAMPTASKDPIPDPQTKPPPPAQPGNEVFLLRSKSITVTDRRVLVGPEIHLLNAVTSARFRMVLPVWRYLLVFAIPLVTYFAGFALGKLVLGLKGIDPALIGLISASSGTTPVLAYVGLLAGLVIGIIQAVLARPKYVLMLRSGRSQKKIIRLKDRDFAQQVVASINRSLHNNGNPASSS